MSGQVSAIRESARLHPPLSKTELPLAPLAFPDTHWPLLQHTIVSQARGLGMVTIRDAPDTDPDLAGYLVDLVNSVRIRIKIVYFKYFHL